MGFKRTEVYVFVFALALSLLSRAIALVSLGHSVDDLVYWSVPLFNYGGVEEVSLRDGRFVLPLLAEVADVLGIDGSRAFTISGVVLSGCLALSAVFICRVWRLDHDWRLSALVAALFVAHPYVTDFFVWKMGMLTAGPGFVLALGSLLIARASWPRVAIGAGLMVLALGIHQIPLSVAVAVLAFAVVFDVIRGASAFGRQRENVRMAAATAAGTVVYVVIAKFLIAVQGQSGDGLLILRRGEFIMLEEPGLVFARLTELTHVVLFADPLTSPAVRIAFAVLVYLAMVQIAVTAVRSRRSVLGAGVVPTAILVAGIAAMTLTVVSANWQPSFRAMCAIGVVWAGVAGAVYLTGSSIVRRACLVCAVVIVTAFVGVSNEMLSDELRASERDRALMTRMVSDLEREVDPASLDYVVFIGTNPSPLAGLATAADISTGWNDYGTTLSVFASWFGEAGYLALLFREVSGYSNVSPAIQPVDLASGRSYCRENPAWPRQGAIAVRTDPAGQKIAVICLSKPVRVTRGRFDVT